LLVRLTNNPVPNPCTPPTFNLLVTWKGVTVINTNLSSFSPYNGRLVLAGRCGGNNQNVHADNIALFTKPVTSVFLGSINGLLNGFTFTLNDNTTPPANSTFNSVVQVLLDATNNVTGSTVVNYTAPNAVGTYTQVARFAPGSTHTAQVCWKDSNNNTNSTALSFVVPQWILFPTNFALPLSAIDTSKPGMRVKSHQALQNNPNQIWWTDEQLMGRRGPTVQGGGTLPSESDGIQTYQVWDGAMDFVNQNAVNPARGFFNLTPGGDNALDLFGLGSGTPYPQDVRFDYYQNSALEFFGYIYFPTSGVYNMTIGSDDSFQLSVSQHPNDRMGQVLWQFIGSRVPTAASPPVFNDIRPVVVDQAGAYPIRFVWENGGGGAASEWYVLPPFGSAAIPNFNAYLVNDTNNSASTVLLYRAANGTVPLGPYVKTADPTRGNPDAVFYTPIVVEVSDGTGSKTLNDASIAISTDGIAVPLTKTRTGTVVKAAQSSAPNWSGGAHTNVLTFSDNLGTNYSYTWTFTVLGGASGVAVVDTTNAPVALPASLALPLSSVTSPGFRIKSYQSANENPTHTSYYEEQFEGLHGTNVADQSGATAGMFSFADGITPPSGPGVLDMRLSFQGSGVGTANNGGAGKFAYDLFGPSDTTIFGVGYYANFPPRDNYRLSGNSRCENSSLQVGAWLYFPAAGTYIMHFNSDDGLKVTVPYGSLFNKMGIVLVEANVGRGMVNAGGVETGGSYAKFTIPAPGAYPFRILWFNAGTDGGLEWSIFQQLSDGTVHRVAINDNNIAGSIKAFQTTTSGDVFGPYISYMNPVFNAQDLAGWQPIVVDVTDGPGLKTLNTGTVVLTVDGSVRTFSMTTPSAGVHHIVQNLGGVNWVSGTHTNILTFSDNAGGTYSNYWTASVPTQLQPFTAVPVPLTNRVDISAVDTSQRGFRVKSYQTTAGTGNSIPSSEEQFLGLKGPNIAIQTGTNGPGYFVWTNAVDFAANNGVNDQNNEHRYNSLFSNFGIVQNGPVNESNNCSLIIAGWVVFPKAGYYCMTVNSDDGFKVTSPYGSNPFSQAGQLLGQVAGTRGGNNGYNANPFALGGSVSPCLFSIPAAGAYPIRLVWFNGGGGISLEWTMFQYFTNDDVGRVIVGDQMAPGAYPVYQTLLVDEPYVLGVFPTPAPGLVGPELTLTPGMGPTNVAGGVQNLSIQLQDGFVRTVNTNTITLTFNGISQPISITSNGAGTTTVVRDANALPWWPSGNYGQLILSFQDNNGTTISESWNLFTGFWGTLNNALSLSQINTNEPGFAVRLYQLDALATSGTTTIPNRVHVAEQILAGLWGPNVAVLTTNNDGKFYDLIGTGKSNGVVNLNIITKGENGDFRSTGGFLEKLLQGIPGAVTATVNSDQYNDIAAEILSYVEFPTNGNYILGVSSDDGFRLTRGFNAPTNIGTLVVNSPAGVAGPKATVQNTFLSSYSLTNPVTGNLVRPSGISFSQGSTTNGEGCVITDPPGTLVGKIALMYRSGFCSYVQQVSNAVAAGAIGVVFIQNRTNTEGPFPQEPGVNPPTMPIPAVQIMQADGNALGAILATNGIVNVTLTPMQYLINPPAGTAGPLGQADQGKGASDIVFPVVVQQAGVYPLRLMWWTGGGDGNVEFFSVTGTNRTLINDLTATNGPSLTGTGLRAFFPKMNISISLSGGNVTLTYDGILQSAPVVTGPYTDVLSATSPYTVPANQPLQFYRTRFPN
jgi:hypothetical protein